MESAACIPCVKKNQWKHCFMSCLSMSANGQLIAWSPEAKFDVPLGTLTHTNEIDDARIRSHILVDSDMCFCAYWSQVLTLLWFLFLGR